MITAAYLAFQDTLSPTMRSILWRSIALSIALFAALWFCIEFILSSLTFIPWAWALTAMQLVTGLGLFAAFFFLMSPVTALFAGLFQDRILAKLEAEHYPQDPKGLPLAGLAALLTGLKFAALALGMNLVVLPLVFFLGFGVILMWLANAYLISREYFTMIAARYVPLATAMTIRNENALRIFIAGLVPGALALVPFINFTTPVFATSYFLHLFKKGNASLF